VTNVSGDYAPGLDLRELPELAAADAGQAERDRHLTPRVFEAIRDAGFPRHFVPMQWKGNEGGFLPYLTAVTEVARKDASAGWCAAIAGTLSRMAAFLPDEGQAALWAQGPDSFVVGALVPAGKAVLANGGWTLSGQWDYVSGIHASDHALLACRVPSTDTEPEGRFLLVHRSAYHIKETWRTMGMRGTGSDTLVIDEAFVPTQHSFPMTALVAGKPARSGAPSLTVPLRSVSGLTFAAPILGSVRGALDAWSSTVIRKRAAGWPQPQASATPELVLARSAGEADAAELLLARVAAAADEGGLRDEWGGARAQRDQVLAVDLLIEAVNRLLRTGGTSGQKEGDDLQRFWRDANAGASHAVLAWEPAARRYAAACLAQFDAPSGAHGAGA
jgi:alkylation response protein AidB-like acyl-CoA dehydrogenase